MPLFRAMILERIVSTLRLCFLTFIYFWIHPNWLLTTPLTEIILRKGTNDFYASSSMNGFQCLPHLPSLGPSTVDHHLFKTPLASVTSYSTGIPPMTKNISLNFLGSSSSSPGSLMLVFQSWGLSTLLSLSFLSWWSCPLPVFTFYIYINNSQHMSISKIS